MLFIWNYEFLFLFLNFIEAQQLQLPQTTATLSQARGYLAATSSNELVFFGG
jgi:hypothetical protein